MLKLDSVRTSLLNFDPEMLISKIYHVQEDYKVLSKVLVYADQQKT